MTRHLADHQAPSTGGRLKHFLRLARAPRGIWHRSQGAGSQTRIVQFLRIARGRTA